MSPTLPFTPIAQPGEAPLSLLRRGALGNGHASSLRFAFSLNATLDHAPTALATLARNPLIFRDTCHAMGIPDDEIVLVSYQRTGRAREDEVIWNGLRVAIGDLQFRRAKLCVACYLEHGYAMSEWDHVAAVACSRHRILLSDACPCCSTPWSHIRDPLGCGCNPQDMAHRQRACATEPATLLRRLIDSGSQAGLRLLGRTKAVLNWWKRLRLPMPGDSEATTLSDLHAGRWPQFVAKPTSTPTTPLHPKVMLAPLLAYLLLDHVQHAKAMLNASVPTLSSNEIAWIKWPASTAMSVLGIGRVPFAKLVKDGVLISDDRGRVLVSAINELLWTPSGTRDRGATVELGHADKLVALPDGRNDSRDITLAIAAARLRTNTESVRGVIRVGLLQARKGTAHSAVQWRIDHDRLESFDHRYVFASALAENGGSGRTTLSSRLRSADLRPISGPGIDGGITFLFRRADLRKIELEAIRHEPYRSPAGRKKRPNQDISTTTLSQPAVADILGIPNRQIRGAVAQGWLSPLDLTVTRWRFDPAAIRRLQKNMHLEYRDLAEAIQATGQSTSEFRRTWIDTGFLTTRRFGTRILISATDLDRIIEAWKESGTCAAIGRELSRPRWLCPNLEKMGKLQSPTIIGVGIRKVRLYPRGDLSLLRYLRD